MTRALVDSVQNQFVPKQPSLSGEDDGYLIFFVHDGNTGKSEVNVINAMAMSADPVAVVELPNRVPYGFHAFFVNEVMALMLWQYVVCCYLLIYVHKQCAHICTASMAARTLLQLQRQYYDVLKRICNVISRADRRQLEQLIGRAAYHCIKKKKGVERAPIQCTPTHPLQHN